MQEKFNQIHVVSVTRTMKKIRGLLSVYSVIFDTEFLPDMSYIMQRIPAA